MQPKAKTVIKSTAYIVGGVWSVLTAIAGLQFDDLITKFLSFLPLLVVLLFTVWDRWVWRWKPVVRFSGLPDLSGTWKGQYDAEWADPTGKRRKESGPAVLTITQTFTTLSITFMTKRSKSYSSITNITKLQSGEFRVNYEYMNTPTKPSDRETIHVHDGSAQLTIASPRGSHLAGEYWTNRMSRGTLKFDWVSKTIVQSIEAADNLTSNIAERDV